TDQPGKLNNALVKRIPNLVDVAPYTSEEMREIVKLVASKHAILISSQAAGMIARVCGGLPRRGPHHIINLRLHFEDSEKRQQGVKDVRAYLRGSGIDRGGVENKQRRYLRFLARNDILSLETLAGRLGVDGAYVRREVERPLRFLGLIDVGQNGRRLTEEGLELARRRRWLKASKGGSR